MVVTKFQINERKTMSKLFWMNIEDAATRETQPIVRRKHLRQVQSAMMRKIAIAALHVSICCLFLTLLPFIVKSQTNEVKPYAPELFPSNVSGSVCGFSPDGKIIYFVREDASQKKLFIYQAQRSGEKWVNARLLPFSGVYSDMGGRLSRDGKTFYFTSDRPGGSSKEKDTWKIWAATLRGDVWSAPEPLSGINDKGMECCPLPLKDGRLMFSADRGKPNDWWISIYDPTSKSETLESSLNQNNAWQWTSSLSADEKIIFINSMKRADTKGMDDIYVAFAEDGKWSAPINIGEPVNSKVYEDGAILTPDRKLLIFNRHETHETPSNVMSIEWEPLFKKLKNDFKAQKRSVNKN